MLLIDFQICVLAASLILVPILAIITLRQSRSARTQHRVGWEAARPLIIGIALLLDLALLLILTVLGQIRGVSAHYLRTEVSDGFLLFSLLLLIASVVVSESRWKLSAASVLLLVSWLVTEQLSATLRDDGSRLSVLLTRAGDKMGLEPAGMTLLMLHKMNNYEKRGMYDAAIVAGIRWTKRDPTDSSNDQVFLAIACAFLHKAQQDSKHAEEYVRQALLYRDKAIPIVSSTHLEWYRGGTIQEMASISEAAGDISDDQRCVQYRNVVRLLQLLDSLAKDKQDEISRRFGPKQDEFGVTLTDVERYKNQVAVMLARVRDKQQKSSCPT